MSLIFRLFIFHCTRTFENEAEFLPAADPALEMHAVPMACSSMVKDLFLLKALEAGADAVTVWVCPEGACRHGEGNLRARKRVQRVQSLLDEIELDGRRLTLFHLAPGDRSSAIQILREISEALVRMGKNPAGIRKDRLEKTGGLQKNTSKKSKTASEPNLDKGEPIHDRR